MRSFKNFDIYSACMCTIVHIQKWSESVDVGGEERENK